MPAPHIPLSIFLSQGDGPMEGLVSIGAHLLVSSGTARQFNTPHMPWPVAIAALEEWADDRAAFYLKYFGWNPDAIAAEIAVAGKGKGTGGVRLSLSDIGL